VDTLLRNVNAAWISQSPVFTQKFLPSLIASDTAILIATCERNIECGVKIAETFRIVG
jgi:hypothetical protein